MSSVKFIVIVALALELAVPVCAQQESDIVVKIDEYSITKMDVFELLSKRYPLETQEAIRELVIRRIIKEEYKKEGIKIKMSFAVGKAQDEFERFKKEVLEKEKQGWQYYLKARDISEQNLKSEILSKWKYRLSLECLIRLSQMREKRVEARQIMVDTLEKAQTILEKLKNNADFGAMARQESLSRTKIEGGKLGAIFPGDFPESLDRVFFSLSPGQISDIVHSPWGYHIIQVLRVHAARNDATWENSHVAIEISLGKEPLSSQDIKRWLERMNKKYHIQEVFKPR